MTFNAVFLRRKSEPYLDKFYTYGVKVIVLILALQMLNISVYSRSYEYYAKDENGHTVIEENQIDSFIEYITEVVLDFRDAFPEDTNSLNLEHGGNYKAPHTIMKNVMVQLAVPVHYTGWGQNEPSPATPKFSIYKDYYYQFSREINPPPPKA